MKNDIKKCGVNSNSNEKNARYALRKKSKVDYKSLHEGRSIRSINQKIQLPPKFGWDSDAFSSDSDNLLPMQSQPIISQPGDASNLSEPENINEALYQNTLIDNEVFDDKTIVRRSSLNEQEYTARSSSMCFNLLSTSSPHSRDELDSHNNNTAQTSTTERQNSIIICPNNTCDVAGMLPAVVRADLTPLSPPVTHQNYPLLFNFIAAPDTQVTVDENIDVQEVDFHPVPESPGPYRNLRVRSHPVDYLNLHNYGRDGPDGWGTLEEGEEEDTGRAGWRQ